MPLTRYTNIQLAAQLIEHFEGFSAEAYKCPGNVWTIGFGRTGGDVVKGVTSAYEREKAWLDNEVKSLQNYLNALPTARFTEIGHRNAALISFIYNIGRGAFAKSTLYKRLLEHKLENAAHQFPRWKYANGQVLVGLLRRRIVEKKIFMCSDPTAILADLAAGAF